MKKFLSVLLALTLSVSLFAGCGAPAASSSSTAPATSTSQESSTPAPTTKTLKIANVVNGNLGDKSFFDSCEAGLAQLKKDGKIEYKTFELGATDADQPKWKSTLDEVSLAGEYDIIICGTWQMNEYLAEIAPNYPDQKYIIYDSAVDAPNVLSIGYQQNTLGYLVGTAAAMATTSGIDRTNPEKVIGFIGGEDGPVINDFLIGFIDGAVAADPEIKIDTQYVGNFYDTGAAKELANVMVKTNKCDLVWGVAGGAGNGAVEAVKDNSGWFIGVDSDQEATFSISQPELAAVTLFSGLKNIDKSMIWAVDQHLAGTAPYGTTVNLGLNEDGVGIATAGNFAKLPDAIKQAVEKAAADITSGAVKVRTAFGDSAADVKAEREKVRP